MSVTRGRDLLGTADMRPPPLRPSPPSLRYRSPRSLRAPGPSARRRPRKTRSLAGWRGPTRLGLRRRCRLRSPRRLRPRDSSSSAARPRLCSSTPNLLLPSTAAASEPPPRFPPRARPECPLGRCSVRASPPLAPALTTHGRSPMTWAGEGGTRRPTARGRALLCHTRTAGAGRCTCLAATPCPRSRGPAPGLVGLGAAMLSCRQPISDLGRSAAGPAI
jgi:hypothetical protein